MRKTEEKTIEGQLFKVTQLPAMKSTLLMHKLASTLGIPLLKSLSGVSLGEGKGLPKVGELDVGTLAGGLESLFERFTEADLERLIRTLLEPATITRPNLKGEPTEVPLMPVFDQELAGQPATVLQLLKFALEVNYGNFLAALFANARALQGK